MERKIFLYFLCLFFIKAAAQDTAFYFSARIVDVRNGNPVPYAVIESTESFHKTFADENGKFSLMVKKTGEILRVKADNYFEAYYSFPTVIQPDNVWSLKPLKRGDKDSPEIYWQSIFRNGKFTVLDFDFFSNEIFLIVKDKSSLRFALIVTDSSGKVISLRHTSESLVGFRSISGVGNFLLGQNYVYRIAEDRQSRVVWDSAISVKTFENYYFSRPYNDSSGSYVCYDSKPEFFLNNEASVMARNKYSTCYVRLKKNNRLSLFKNFADEVFQKTPGQWKRVSELQMPEVPHTNSPVVYFGSPYSFFSTQDKLVLADEFNYRLEVFDLVGKFIQGIDFYKGKEKFDYKKILYDKMSGQFYFVSSSDNPGEMNSGFLLQLIDPVSGKIVHHKFPFFSYISSLRIQNGFAYYIFAENGTRFLVRTRL